MTLLDRLTRWFRVRPRPLDGGPDWQPPADLALSRLDILDGVGTPRGIRPVTDCDDVARHLVAEHAGGRHAGDTYQEWLDVLIGSCEDQWPDTRPIGRHRAADPGTVTVRQVIDDALDTDLDDLELAPCLQWITGPPFEACPEPADPSNPDQLCETHANRKRS